MTAAHHTVKTNAITFTKQVTLRGKLEPHAIKSNDNDGIENLFFDIH